MARRLPRWLVTIALLAIAHVAWAGASRVAIVRPAKPDAAIHEATTRLAAELRAAGFDVVLVDAAPGMDPRAQVEVARMEPRPFATIAILARERGAACDVWVADHLSAKTLVRRVDVADAAATGAPSALAIRAVELLRASLLEIGAHPAGTATPLPDDVAKWMGQPAPPPAAPPAVVAPPGPAVFPLIPPPAAPPVARAPRGDPALDASPPPASGEEPDGAARRAGTRPGLFERPALEGGASLLVSSAGIGTSFAPVLRVSLGLPLGLAGRASFVGPTLGKTLESATNLGTATLHQELLELELVGTVADRASDVVPMLSLGLGGYHMRVQGTATTTGFIGRHADVWALALDVGAGLAARLDDDLALLLDVHAVALVPDPVVVIGDVEAGRAGFPLLLTSLGLIASF